MSLRKVPMFDAEFDCDCGTRLHIYVPVAVVRSRTGAFKTCEDCRRRWRVTEKGAQQVSERIIIAELSAMEAERQLRALESATALGAIRQTQSGGQNKQRSTEAPVWTLRLPRMRRDT